jgi:hypothetical protein
MGQCHQTTLVTVTYLVINYILRTLAYTLCLSDILPVINCTNYNASLEDITNLSCCFDCVPAFFRTLNQRLTSLYPSTNQHHGNKRKWTFLLRHILGKLFCQQLTIINKKAIRFNFLLTAYFYLIILE